MQIDKQAGSESFEEAFDRALDKGIVVDAHERLSPAGIDLRGPGGRVVVAAVHAVTRHDAS